MAGHEEILGQENPRFLLFHFSLTKNQRGQPGVADLSACPEAEKELEGDSDVAHRSPFSVLL